MSTFLTIIHVVICLVLIGVVLLQSGREGGGDIGGGGGGGMKPVQSGNKFMERLTSTMAVVFMITSIVLAAQGAGSSVMQGEKTDAPAGVAAEVKDEGASKAVELDEAAKADAPAAADKAPAAEGEAKEEAKD
jgi:preprotein translocase subunit SecG